MIKRRAILIVLVLGLAALWIGSEAAIAAPKVQPPPAAELEEQAAALNELGGAILDRVGQDGGKALLYVERHGKKLQGAIFSDRGAFVEYRELDNGLLKPILALWRAPPPDKRWAAFSYLLVGRKVRFEATFPEELGPEEDVNGRIDRAGATIFGNKPVHYPDGSSTVN